MKTVYDVPECALPIIPGGMHPDPTYGSQCENCVHYVESPYGNMCEFDFTQVVSKEEYEAQRK